MDTKEAIKRQFIKEYAVKDIHSFTVKGLCASVPIARTTFYTYFSGIDDVLLAVEDDLLAGLAQVADSAADGSGAEMDFFAFMDNIEAYIKVHWAEIYALLAAQPDLRFISRWKELIKQNFARRYPAKTQCQNYDAIADVLASAMISIYTYWLQHPDTGNVAEMKRLIEHMLNSLVAFM